MARKFIYYLKGYSRTIVITDKGEDEPIEEIVSKISQFMSGCKVSKFETDNDILIVRPSDIIGVHIAKDSSKHEEEYKMEDEPEENIRLQSIVTDIDLGDIESDNDELGIDEIVNEETVNMEDDIEEDIVEDIENSPDSDDEEVLENTEDADDVQSD